MISGLASYLFGYSGEGEEGLSVLTPPIGRVMNGNIEMSTSVADNDWLLVDVMDESKETNSVRSDGCSTNCTPSPQPSDVDVPVFQRESWFVTPTPCFNASTTSLSSLTTSPLENLLIEHPSMSVYGPHLSMVQSTNHHVTGFPPIRTDCSRHKKAKRRNKKNKENSSGVVSPNSPPSASATATAAAAAVQFGLSLTKVVSMSVKTSQTSLKHRDHYSLSPHKIDRTNKLIHHRSGAGGKREKRHNLANTYKLCSNRC